MKLHARVFSIYVWGLILGVSIVVCVPLTILLRVAFGDGVPAAIDAMIADPLLALIALLLVPLLWSGILTFMGSESEPAEEAPSNHRRGRVVESRMSDDCEEILRERRATRSRNTDQIRSDPVGFGRPNRFGFSDQFEEDFNE